MNGALIPGLLKRHGVIEGPLPRELASQADATRVHDPRRFHSESLVTSVLFVSLGPEGSLNGRASPSPKPISSAWVVSENPPVARAAVLRRSRACHSLFSRLGLVRKS